MDDLTDLRAQPAPREGALVRRLGRRVVPAWGFVAYGVLYAFVPVAAALAGFVGTLLGLHAAQLYKPPVPGWALAICWAAALLLFVAAWWPFTRFAARRRGAAHRVIRDGRLVDAAIVDGQRITLRGSRFVRAVLRIPDGAAAWQAVLSVPGDPDLAVGATLPVLFAPGSPHCIAFVDGRAIAASLK